MTYALREACARATKPLPAQTARRMAPEALIPLEIYSVSFHDPFHAWLVGPRLAREISLPRVQVAYLACTR
jgi:hypothetical protein